MSKNGKKTKEPLELEKVISPVFVVNKSSLRPYIESFEYHPENITQQPLGILLGFFEVKEYSDDSSYIVNFLTSVVKKEYYKNPKRSVGESFDSALHKANLALAEIAKHGNVNWLGKLDAVICVLEKNNIHFSLTGNAKIFLSRKEIVTDIGEGLSVDGPSIHPIKTFVDVSSGRIQSEDKLIITSEDLFDVFTQAELKKNILRFPRDKFSQLINTALKNELDIGSTIVVDFIEKKAPSKEASFGKKPKKESNYNVFSQKAFEKKKNKSKKSEINPEDLEDKEKEYTDKKTGHIYIKGENSEEIDQKKTNENLQIAREFASNMASDISSFSKKQLKSAWNKTKGLNLKEKVIGSFVWCWRITKSLLIKIKEKYKARKEEKKYVKEIESKLGRTYNTDAGKVRNFSKEINKLYPFSKNSRNILDSIRSILKNTSSFLPKVSKIKNIFSKLSVKQKISALIIIIAIVTVPIIFSKIGNENTQLPQENPQEIQEMQDVKPAINETLSNEKNISFLDEVETIHSSSNDLVSSLIFEGEVYVISENSIIEKSTGESFNLPTESGKVIESTYMEDLNLFFLSTDQRNILSFSPITSDFTQNSINLEQEIYPEITSTYLTYLYVLKKDSNQIIRFPRAEGGFGEGSEWIREDIDLSNVKDLAIDENIYAARGEDLIKMFQGQLEQFELEKAEVNPSFDKVYANLEMNNIYVLDKKSSRIISYSKEGKIQKQYYHERISDGINLTVSEQLGKIYLTTKNEVILLSI